MRLEITRIGNSSGLILPKELLAKLRLERGDAVTITEAPGGFNVRSSDPEFEKGMAIAREGARLYRDALAELAKK